MKISKKIIIPVVIIAVVLITTILFFKKNSSQVKVHPTIGKITEAVYSLGKVKSNQIFEIKLGVLSTVQELYTQEGALVQKNQKLLKIDSGSVFKAPFTGTVTLIKVHEGEMFSPQMTLLKLENLNDLYIELTLEQESALRIKKNQKARISFESLRGENLEGYVETILSQNDEFIAKVKVNHLPENILPGMSADVSVEVGEVTGTLVPLKALKNGTLVIERNGHQTKEKAVVGLTDALSAEIKSPELKESDYIILPKE